MTNDNTKQTSPQSRREILPTSRPKTPAASNSSRRQSPPSATQWLRWRSMRGKRNRRSISRSEEAPGCPTSASSLTAVASATWTRTKQSSWLRTKLQAEVRH